MVQIAEGKWFGKSA